MKKLSWIILFIMPALLASAQLKLDKRYNHSAVSTKINGTDYKIFIMDTELNQCRIYNTNHTLYKTIDLEVPNNMFLYDIRFVSENLFDLDEKIELLYVYYDYIITDATDQSGYYKYYTRVINEDGNELLKVDGGLYSYMYMINSQDYRLFIYSYDYSTLPISMWTDLYEVPGIPYFLSAKSELKSGTIGNAYPNPASNFVTIAYSLPEGIYEAHLNIYTMGGTKAAGYTVDRNFNNIQIEAGSLLPGNYLYYIESQGKRSEAKKLIIQ